MTAPTVDDVKLHLNLTSSTDDAELQHMLDAAVDRISYEVGPLASASFVEDHVEHAANELILRQQPATALTTVTEETYFYQSASYTTTATWQLVNGILYRRPYPLFNGPTIQDSWKVTVTYTAGWNPLPEDLRLAVLELVRHFWLTQQGSRSRSDPQSQQMRGSQEMIMQAMAYSLPNRVKELLEPYRQRTRAA